MTREEAKNMAKSRDCRCVKGKDRDSNYAECIDKIFDWFESEHEGKGKAKKLLQHWHFLIAGVDKNHQQVEAIKNCMNDMEILFNITRADKDELNL